MVSADDLSYMARALRLAEKGRYTTHPNPCVGCVLVRQGEIVGEGFHSRAGEGHAEANALMQAGGRARDATAYVTLEPCSFHGRTPSCARALIDAGVSRVVVATPDPDPRNAGAGIELLREAGMETAVGALESGARQMIRGHVKRHTKQMPFVGLKLAMTMDGKTALANGESRWITSAAARADVQKLRARSAAIVTGSQTVIDDDPRLNVRAEELHMDCAHLAASITRPVYVLDSRGRLPEDVWLLQQPDTVHVVAAGMRGDLVLPTTRGRIDLQSLLRELAIREHSEVLFECGATLAGSLVREQLVDELTIYIAPKFMGADARSLLNIPEVGRMCDLAELVISDVRQIGPDIRVTASPA